MSSVPAISADPSPEVTRRPGLRVLVGALLVVLALWLPAALFPKWSWADPLDNVHWTFSYSVAAWLAWRSLRHCPAGDLRVRRAMALALVVMAAGQWIWDLQYLIDWNPRSPVPPTHSGWRRRW